MDQHSRTDPVSMFPCLKRAHRKVKCSLEFTFFLALSFSILAVTIELNGHRIPYAAELRDVNFYFFKFLFRTCFNTNNSDRIQAKLAFFFFFVIIVSSRNITSFICHLSLTVIVVLKRNLIQFFPHLLVFSVSFFSG